MESKRWDLGSSGGLKAGLQTCSGFISKYCWIFGFLFPFSCWCCLGVHKRTTSDSILNAGVVAMTNVCNLVRVTTLFHYSDLHCTREVVEWWWWWWGGGDTARHINRTLSLKGKQKKSVQWLLEHKQWRGKTFVAASCNNNANSPV